MSAGLIEGDDLRELMKRLYRMTGQGRLHWRPGGEAVFMAETPNFAFDIRSKDADGLHPFEFRVRSSEEGPVVASVSSASDDREMLVLLEAMYRLARRAAFGVDELLAAVNEDLDNLDEEAPF